MNQTNNAASVGMPELYRFLAQTMRYPQNNLMGEEYFYTFIQIAEKIPGIPDLKRCRSVLLVENKLPERLEILQAEHTRLFINAYPQVISPPYASIYIGSDSCGQGESVAGIEQFYHQKGFQLKDNREPPDWLVNELEFMAILAQEDNEGLEYFLLSHFRQWFPIFKKKIMAETTHPYFAVGTQMIDFFTR